MEPNDLCFWKRPTFMAAIRWQNRFNMNWSGIVIRCFALPRSDTEPAVTNVLQDRWSFIWHISKQRVNCQASLICVLIFLEIYYSGISPSIYIFSLLCQEFSITLGEPLGEQSLNFECVCVCVRGWGCLWMGEGGSGEGWFGVFRMGTLLYV